MEQSLGCFVIALSSSHFFNKTTFKLYLFKVMPLITFHILCLDNVVRNPLKMKASKESAPIGVMRPQQQHRRRSMKTTQSARRLELVCAARKRNEH